MGNILAAAGARAEKASYGYAILPQGIYASWLHQCGISAEEMDFLQGRVSTSVFSRHYLTPKSSLKDRVLEALNELRKEIE